MFRVSQPVSVNKQSVRTDSPCDNMLRRGDSMVDYIETRRDAPSLSKYPLPVESDTSSLLRTPAWRDLPWFKVLCASPSSPP